MTDITTTEDAQAAVVAAAWAEVADILGAPTGGDGATVAGPTMPRAESSAATDADEERATDAVDAGAQADGAADGAVQGESAGDGGAAAGTAETVAADVADSSADDADADDPDAGVVSANLAMALRSIHRRKELRQLLIVLGAIVPGAPPVTAGPQANNVTTERMVGQLMGLGADQLERMIRRAGMIASESRITTFAEHIASESGEHDPYDPVAVHVWVGRVGAILRDQD